ncbi:MAG: metal ABC transporter ATP-binding protein [Candidatus Asgardarchaeum californiense]|nr:MAG: metal ABC transporter ATP-binding protein [Candidatus Asgardarchaeum californiense]
MNQEDYIIELQDVNTIYEGEKTPAIYNINLYVQHGEFISVIGPNGAGKTTLLETINGILPYTSGYGSIFGKEIKKYKIEIRKDIGYIIQNFDIDPLSPFLCKDIVMTGRAGKIGLFRFASKNDWKAVWHSLGLVGMIDFAQRPIGKLSGGEFQKILFARALVQEPQLLLLDEPFSNLDLSARQNIEKILTKIYHKRKITILMVSHELRSIPKECSRIIVLDKGKIIMDGDREEILSSEIVHSLFHNGGCCHD